MKKKLLLLLCFMATGLTSPVIAQTTDDEDEDIWRRVDLGGLDYQKAKNHCVRLYAYYRFTDDGVAYFGDRETKLYRVYEGICQLDIRYSRDEDDGADIIVGRDLVHPEKPGHFMDFYELKPYTFLEKALRDPKRYTVEAVGDTTRVYTKLGLAGIAVKDTARHELRMTYNALSPDTAYSINLLIVKARLSHVDTEAIYRIDDNDVSYVPQGNLKRVLFEGDITLDSPISGSMPTSTTTSDSRGPIKERFHERTEIYVDSVVYMTRDEYRAMRRQSLDTQRAHSGYTIDDIDRLRTKLGVPPLTSQQQERIDAQRDWDDEYELWLKTERKLQKSNKL